MSSIKYNNKSDQLRSRISQVISKRIPEISKKTGWKDPVIRRWANGSLPGIDKIEELCGAIGVSIQWLLTGEEKPDPVLSIQTVPKMQTFHHDFASDNFIPVRLLRDQIAAGSPAHINENDVEGYCIIYADKEWMNHDPENYTCVKVQGKSMYPILDSGDIVAIDHSDRDPASLDKKMVAFRKNGGVTIKWLKVLEGGKIIVGVPENKDDFDSVISLQGKEIETGIVGKIAWWWAKRK